MQTVPYMAFTTKSAGSGNSGKTFQRSGDSMGRQSGPAAFGETLQQASRQANGKGTGNAVTTRPKPASHHERAGTVRSGGREVELAETQDAKAASSTRGEKEIMQVLAALSQLFGSAGEVQAENSLQTGAQAGSGAENSASDLANLQMTQTLKDLIKTLTGQTRDLQEITGTLQKLLQQLGLKLDVNGSLPNQGSTAPVVLLQELLAGLNSESDMQGQRQFLVKLTEAAARLGLVKETAELSEDNQADQTQAAGGQNGPAQRLAGQSAQLAQTKQGEDRNAEVKPNEVKPPGIDAFGEKSEQAKLWTQMAEVKQAGASEKTGLTDVKAAERKPSGDNLTEAASTEAKAKAIVRAAAAKPTEAGSPEAKASEAKASEAKASEAKASVDRSTEAKASEDRSTEAKPVRIADSQQPDTGHGQIRMKGAGTSVNSSHSQDEFRPYEHNNSFLSASEYLSSAQSAKTTPPLNIPRMAQMIFGQITQKAKLLITPETTEMQIQLKPDFLGKMNLSIASENGLVTAKFHTESYRVKEVIEANLNTLKDSLAQQGVRVDQLVVSVGTQKDYSGYQGQNHSHYYHNSGSKSEKAGNINEEGFAKLFPADLESRSIQAYYGNTVDFKA